MNPGNALIQHLSEKTIDFRIFPFAGSAEAQLIWGGTVNRLLIAYFIGNISARNYQMCSPMSRYSKPKVGRFFETQCSNRGLASFLSRYHLYSIDECL